ncbi:hypothetical protein HNY73_000446 [Argiope bruennichi]|uniref:Uncharacterized protein n=1 Tax=Argiope bruennichi TaxID=94029 RepID=A0A8T0G0H7_ARGBR|nr:hypothetical protein HNY73_000446 [Argiope bruennichi]
MAADFSKEARHPVGYASAENKTAAPFVKIGGSVRPSRSYTFFHVRDFHLSTTPRGHSGPSTDTWGSGDLDRENGCSVGHRLGVPRVSVGMWVLSR